MVVNGRDADAATQAAQRITGSVAHPGSYAKPAVTPVGIDHVVLGGRIVVDHGDFTGVRAGAVLRAGRG